MPDTTQRVEALEATKSQKAKPAAAQAPQSLWTFITPVEAYSGVGAVAWTSYDANACIPDSASLILLLVTLGQANGPDTVDVNYRINHTEQAHKIGHIIGGAGDSVGHASQFFYPTSGQSFDFEVIAASNVDVKIEIIGYFS